MFEVAVEFAGRRWVAGSRDDWDAACALCARWFRSLYHPDARWSVRGGGREAVAVLSIHGSVWVRSFTP